MRALIGNIFSETQISFYFRGELTIGLISILFKEYQSPTEHRITLNQNCVSVPVSISQEGRKKGKKRREELIFFILRKEEIARRRLVLNKIK